MEYIDFFIKDVSKIQHKGLFKYLSTGNPFVVSILIFVALIPFSLVAIVIQRVQMIYASQMNIEKKNILYVIAHPDDEAM